jgi:hypothetical protein
MLTRILETVISLAFIYFLLAIFISGFNEWLSAKRGRRGKFLRLGLTRLIPDDAVYRRLLHHPLVESLYRERVAKGKMPSYIPPSDFAVALMDVIVTRAAKMTNKTEGQTTLTFPDLEAAVRTLQSVGSPLSRALLPILDRAQGDLTKAAEGIERWFNGGMDRVSGWYKEAAMSQLFLLSMAITVLGNVDTLYILQVLWRTPQLTAQIADAAARTVEKKESNPTADQARAELQKLEAQGLPIGFSCLGQASLEQTDWKAVLDKCAANAKQQAAGNWALKIIGWLITALAVSMGAPFWFDLLSRLINVRGSGPKPASAAASHS